MTEELLQVDQAMAFFRGFIFALPELLNRANATMDDGPTDREVFVDPALMCVKTTKLAIESSAKAKLDYLKALTKNRFVLGISVKRLQDADEHIWGDFAQLTIVMRVRA